MAVRQVSHKGGNLIGHFPSLTMHDLIPFESTIERDYLYLADYDATILAIAAQPLTITYEHAGKTARYTPDFYLRTATREVLVECKHHTQVASDDNVRKFQAARTWCAERGWDFCVVTDTDLRSGYRLANVKLLTYYARCAVPAPIHAQLTSTLRGRSAALPLSYLLSSVEGYPSGSAYQRLETHHNTSGRAAQTLKHLAS